MGIETKYAYKYYTVINVEQWRNDDQRIWEEGRGYSLNNVIEFINNKFKNSDDKSVNKYRVDYAQYEDDIEHWRRARERNKEMTIFVQFQEDQPIIMRGANSLYVLYEEDQEDDYSTNDEGEIIMSDIDYDSLARYGGRL